MVEFFTEGPGPGTYTLPSTFGAPSRMPTARPRWAVRRFAFVLVYSMA